MTGVRATGKAGEDILARNFETHERIREFGPGVAKSEQTELARHLWG